MPAVLAGLAILAGRSLHDGLLVMLALGIPHLAVCMREWEGAILRKQRPSWRTSLLSLPRSLSPCLQGLVGFWNRMLTSSALCFQWVWPSAAFGVLVVLSLIPPLARRMPVQDSRDWPIAALDWAEAQDLHGRFFPPPDYGSYLGWRLRARALTQRVTRGALFTPYSI